MPAAPRCLVQNTGSGSVVVGPGFSPPSLTVLTSGVGDVLAYSVNATRAAVTAQGWVHTGGGQSGVYGVPACLAPASACRPPAGDWQGRLAVATVTGHQQLHMEAQLQVGVI